MRRWEPADVKPKVPANVRKMAAARPKDGVKKTAAARPKGGAKQMKAGGKQRRKRGGWTC